MLKKFWPRKDYKKEFQESIEGMTRILMHQIRAKDKDAARNLESLRQLIKGYLYLLEKDPEWFRVLSINEDYAHRIKDEFSASFFYEDYAETITKITRDLIQIFDTAYEAKEDDVSYVTVHVLIDILEKLSSMEGSFIFIKVVLQALSKLHYEMANEARPVVHILSVQWYISVVFGWDRRFRYEYLDIFNEYLFDFLKRFPESNNNKIFQSVVSSLADGITLPVNGGEQIFNFYFRLHIPEEQLPYTFNDLDEILINSSLGKSLKTTQERADKLDVVVNALLPFTPSDINKDEILQYKEETKKAFFSKYSYWLLVETLFVTASYFLFKKKYDYVLYLWEYHQPSDADATWCGDNIVPETLNALFLLYFKNLYFERKYRYFDGHHGSSVYYFHYFILLSMRLIWKSKQEQINLNEYTVGQKADIKYKLDSIIATSKKLAEDHGLMRGLGFEIEEVNKIASSFQDYVETLKSNIELERDTMVISASPNKSKIEEFKKDFIKGFIENAFAREWFVQTGLFDNRVDQDNPSDESKYGISILLDKEIFFEEWDISALGLGNNIGRDMGISESKTIFNEIASFCKPLNTDRLKKAIVNCDISLENLIIFTSYQFSHYSLSHDENYLPSWRVQSKKTYDSKLKGYYQIDEYEIPIYSMPSNKANCLLLDQNRLGYLVQKNPFSFKDKSGSELFNDIFYFYLKAFSEDMELLKLYLKNANKKGEGENYLKKKILLEIHERLDFQPVSNFCGYSLTSPKEEAAQYNLND